MKKVVLTALCLLFIGSMAFAQRQKTDIFHGTISGIPGMQPAAPVTFSVDNTTGECSFVSKGNGSAVGPFTWKGQIPSAKNYSLGQPGAVWSGQLTECSNMTYDKGESRGTLKAALNDSNNAPIAGMTDLDGKSVSLTIRIPYVINGQLAPIPFICTLDVTPGQSANPDGNLEDSFGEGFESLDNMSEEEYNEYIKALYERTNKSEPDRK